MLRNPLALWITRQQKPLKTPQRNWTHVKIYFGLQSSTQLFAENGLLEVFIKVPVPAFCIENVSFAFMVIFTFAFPFKIQVPLVWNEVDNMFYERRSLIYFPPLCFFKCLPRLLAREDA